MVNFPSFPPESTHCSSRLEHLLSHCHHALSGSLSRGYLEQEIVDGIPKRVIAVEKGILARDQVLGTYIEA